MLLKIIPENTKFPFTKYRWHGVIISTLLNIAAIASMVFIGFNFGVDFKGGVTIEVASSNPIDITAVRSGVSGLGLGAVKVQAINDASGDANGVIVYVERDAEAETSAGADQDEAQQVVAAEIQTKLKEVLGADITFRRTDVVGATVSGELIKKGVMAVVGSILLIIIYVWFRYRWQFGVGAIVATIHDTIMTLGMLSILQVPFDIPMIAAILTIVGYSVNDTVVVFDRMRENLRKFKKMPFGELIDLSINETLSRTVMTSGTVIISLVPLFFFGGEVLRGFSGAILFGVFVGTYSSIFIAAPFLMATGVGRDWVKGAAAPAGA
ncbi:MAG: protein-export membrane protein SecF [Alphaproteobacteria bacterium RIFCSPHIGHO2_12_FULL_63_12]|nr:MAG: protein-export membrane protein SecF [Alphaproteobacteria bacterium RIFCSPHIGHO2_12_FULL_63_12]